MNKFFTIGCLFAALGVAAGAFGAHGLKSVFSPDMLAVYETAVRYQMYHAFGLIIVGIFAENENANSRARMAGRCFIAGIVLFSGSLYALTLTDIRWFGAVTPIGGVAFIVGWVMLGISSLQNPRKA
jgi:uncharacterized membrane protein YgdD (TMEM256/DUF423 family)